MNVNVTKQCARFPDTGAFVQWAYAVTQHIISTLETKPVSVHIQANTTIIFSMTQCLKRMQSQFLAYITVRSSPEMDSIFLEMKI